jgi:cell shape-determining protein MreC
MKDALKLQLMHPIQHGLLYCDMSSSRKKKGINLNKINLSIEFSFIRILISIILLLMLLFLMNRDTAVPKLIKSWVIGITYWTAQLFENSAISEYLANIEDPISKLEREKRELQLRLDEMEIFKKENEDLKAAMSFISKKSKIVGTTYISKTSLRYESEAFIVRMPRNYKEDSGYYVKSNNCIVGKITDVHSDYLGDLSLTVTQNSKTPVYFIHSKQHAILQGSGLNANTMKLLYTSDPKSLIDGDIAVTTGNGMIYPENLIVGYLRFTKNEPEVGPCFDINTLKFAHIAIADR